MALWQWAAVTGHWERGKGGARREARGVWSARRAQRALEGDLADLGTDKRVVVRVSVEQNGALGGVLGQLDLAEREVGHGGIGQRRDLARVARLVVGDEERALLERRDRLGIDVVEPDAAGVAVWLRPTGVLAFRCSFARVVSTVPLASSPCPSQGHGSFCAWRL